MDTTKRFPAVGWVRADKVANEKVLEELNELRKKNQYLRERSSEDEIVTVPERMNASIVLEGNILTVEKNGSTGGTW